MSWHFLARKTRVLESIFFAKQGRTREVFKKFIRNKGLKTALHARDLVEFCHTLQTGSHVRKKSWSMVWICLKDVSLCFARRNPETCFLAKTTVILLYLYSFTNNGWSLRLLEKTWQQFSVFVSNN